MKSGEQPVKSTRGIQGSTTHWMLAQCMVHAAFGAVSLQCSLTGAIQRTISMEAMVGTARTEDWCCHCVAVSSVFGFGYGAHSIFCKCVSQHTGIPTSSVEVSWTAFTNARLLVKTPVPFTWRRLCLFILLSI